MPQGQLSRTETATTRCSRNLQCRLRTRASSLIPPLLAGLNSFVQELEVVGVEAFGEGGGVVPFGEGEIGAVEAGLLEVGTGNGVSEVGTAHASPRHFNLVHGGGDEQGSRQVSVAQVNLDHVGPAEVGL